MTELTIRTTDGRAVTERYNQVAMAYLTRSGMLQTIARGEPLVAFDGDEHVIPAEHVASIEVEAAPF
jgi:hypothetical protein